MASASLLGFLGALPAFAQQMFVSSGAVQKWQTLKIGAGGFVLGLDIANDGTKVCNTDVGGAYIWTGSAWQQLITTLTMPSAQIPTATTYNYLGGVWAINFCHGNSNIIYMLVGSGGNSGLLYKSVNKGVNWTLTAMPKISGGNFGANVSPYKGYNQKMIVDPANGSIVAVANASGINVSLDGGATWNLNATVPAASSGWSSGLVFDPSGGTVTNAGQTQTANVYLTSYGNGVWFSSTGISGTFAQLITGGGPTLVRCAGVDSNGVYYCGDNATNGQVWKYASGTWTSILSFTGNQARVVCVDPRVANAGRVIVSNINSGAQFITETVNAGSSFDFTWNGNGSGSTKNLLSATGDVPWLATIGNPSGNITTGDMKIDPTTGTVWGTTGWGVMSASVPVSQATFTWQSQSVGIEELVPQDIIAPGGKYGFPIPVCEDRPGFCLTDLTSYPTTVMTGASNAVNFGGGGDYASNDANTICVRAYENSVDQSGYSSDGGQTYVDFGAASSTAEGGCIAAATALHFLVCTTGGLWESTDGGASWAQPVGVPTTGWFSSATACNHVAAADRVTIGTLYAARQNGVVGTSGVYSNSGGPWTEVFSGLIAPDGGFNQRLRSVPSNAGHLFWAAGPVTGGGTPPVASYLSISTNGGVAWTAISKANGYTSDVAQVTDVGFGAPAPGAVYPAIYTVAWVDGIYGIWRCSNFNPASPGAESWTSLGQFANNNPDAIKVINGDMGIYGRCYVGFTGTGFAYYG